MGMEPTSLGQFAISAHEMFTELVAAGFTEDHALTFTVRYCIGVGAQSATDDE